MRKTQLLFLIFLFFTVANAQWIVQQVPTTKTLRDIYFADSSQGWVVGDDGIFHTIDGGYNWAHQFIGFVGHVCGISNNELWATGVRDTLLHTNDSGTNWSKRSLITFLDLDSVSSLAKIYFYNNNIGWVYVRGWQSGQFTFRLLKTTDGGNFWYMMVNPLANWGGGNAIIQFLDSTFGLITGTYSPVFKTTDGGESWEQLAGNFGYMVTFDMQFISGNIGWVSTDGPVITTTVDKTTDGGENWFNNITFQCSALSTYLSFVDTLNGWVVQRTCISGGTEIWHTSDGGSSWDLQFIYSPPFYFDPREIFFVNSLNGWVIGENGIVLHTSTGGVTPVELISFTAEVIENEVMLNWTTATETNNQGFEVQRQASSIQPSLGNSPVDETDWDAIGFVTGHGTTIEPKAYSFIDENVSTGTYKYRLKQIDFDGTFEYSNEIGIEVDLTPKEFVLEQNYPNPFNPNTTIRWQSPISSWQTLKVYDILGNEVATLTDEYKPAGYHYVDFDGTNLPSGIYLYRIEIQNIARSLSIIRKMVVIK
jgi:photosystem II stability/assembly factor-like uncharacterized protein